MKNKKSIYSLLRVLLIIFISAGNYALLIAQQEDEADKINKSAIEFFKMADFEQAKKLYAAAYKLNPGNFESNYRLGYLNMINNNFQEAEKYLKKAIEVNPTERRSKIQLAEVYYRQNKFEEAATLLKDAGNQAKSDLLFAFGTKKPNYITGSMTETVIDFIRVDPLPTFKIKINGKEIIVLLDTGGAQILLKSKFAEELGIPIHGSFEGTFAGGRRNTVKYSIVEKAQFGEFIVENVPVGILPLEGISPGGLEINGIVGTQFLYQFLATIDYPGKRLILRKATDEALSKFMTTQYKAIPFFMASTHWMFVWGRANKSEPLLLHVDTGLANGGFSFPPKVAEEKIGLKIDKQNERTGIGGGGEFKFYPAVLKELSLGGCTIKNVDGIIGSHNANPFEFNYDGLISHTFFKNYEVTFDFRNMKLYLK